MRIIGAGTLAALLLGPMPSATGHFSPPVSQPYASKHSDYGACAGNARLVLPEYKKLENLVAEFEFKDLTEERGVSRDFGYSFAFYDSGIKQENKKEKLTDKTKMGELLAGNGYDVIEISKIENGKKSEYPLAILQRYHGLTYATFDMFELGAPFSKNNLEFKCYNSWGAPLLELVWNRIHMIKSRFEEYWEYLRTSGRAKVA